MAVQILLSTEITNTYHHTWIFVFFSLMNLLECIVLVSMFNIFHELNISQVPIIIHASH